MVGCLSSSWMRVAKRMQNEWRRVFLRVIIGFRHALCTSPSLVSLTILLDGVLILAAFGDDFGFTPALVTFSLQLIFRVGSDVDFGCSVFCLWERRVGLR